MKTKQPFKTSFLIWVSKVKSLCIQYDFFFYYRGFMLYECIDLNLTPFVINSVKYDRLSTLK
jgi:hypothetical protein